MPRLTYRIVLIIVIVLGVYATHSMSQSHFYKSYSVTDIRTEVVIPLNSARLIIRNVASSPNTVYVLLGPPTDSNAGGLPLAPGECLGVTPIEGREAVLVTAATGSATVEVFATNTAGVFSFSGCAPPLTASGVSRSTPLTANAFILGTGGGAVAPLPLTGVILGQGGAAPTAIPSPANATLFLNGSATPAFTVVKDTDLATTDVVTNDVTTTKHGFAPKLPNDATKYLDGVGTYTTPAPEVTKTAALTANALLLGAGGTAVQPLPLTGLVLGHGASAPTAIAPPSNVTLFLNGGATPTFTAVKETDLTTTDVSTNDVTTAKHGFAPKLPNDATKYLNGVGSYTVPPAIPGGTTAQGQYNNGGAMAGSSGLTMNATGLLAILWDGQAARTDAVARHVTANTAGVNKTLTSGGAAIGATDKAPGDLILATGPSTGTGRGNIRVQSYVTALATGTGDNVPVDRLICPAPRSLVNNTDTPILSAAFVNNSTIAGSLDYAIHVSDGTDFQIQDGLVTYHGINKGGVLSGLDTNLGGTVKDVSAGTLVVTWSVTSTNPAIITLNVNSSLSPAPGFPVVAYCLHNKSRQAVAVQ